MRTYLNLTLDLKQMVRPFIWLFSRSCRKEDWKHSYCYLNQKDVAWNSGLITNCCCASASLLGVLRNGDLNEFWFNWGDADATKAWPIWMAPVSVAPVCTWAARDLAQMRVLPSRWWATYAWEKKRVHPDAWCRTADVMPSMPSQMHPQHRMAHRMWAQRTTTIAAKDTKVLCAWSVRQTILQLETLVRNAPVQRHIQLHCSLW